MPVVLKSGSLNLLEPSGPVKASNGITFPLSFIYRYKLQSKVEDYTLLRTELEGGATLKAGFLGIGAPRVPGGQGSHISWQSAHEGGKLSTLLTGCLNSQDIPWYSFLLEAE